MHTLLVPASRVWPPSSRQVASPTLYLPLPPKRLACSKERLEKLRLELSEQYGGEVKDVPILVADLRDQARLAAAWADKARGAQRKQAQHAAPALWPPVRRCAGLYCMTQLGIAWASKLRPSHLLCRPAWTAWRRRRACCSPPPAPLPSSAPPWWPPPCARGATTSTSQVLLGWVGQSDLAGYSMLDGLDTAFGGFDLQQPPHERASRPAGSPIVNLVHSGSCSAQLVLAHSTHH